MGTCLSPPTFSAISVFCTLSALDVFNFIMCAKTPTAPTYQRPNHVSPRLGQNPNNTNVPTSQSFGPMTGTKPQPHQRTNVPTI